MGWSGRLCILVFTWVRAPPVSRGPTDNGRPSGFQAWSPLWVFTSPFWKHTGWCLNRDPQRGGLQQPPLSFCLFCVPPPFTSPWSSFLHSCPIISKISCLSFKFCLAALCCSFVWPTAPASLCQHCGHDRALQPWNAQPTLPETAALGYWVEWDFKEKAGAWTLPSSAPTVWLFCLGSQDGLIHLQSPRLRKNKKEDHFEFNQESLIEYWNINC